MSVALWWLLALVAAPPGAAELAEPPAAMTCFVSAYADTVCGAAPDALTLCSGARIPWDDGREIFERHGFVWGGKWYHFDTMHFEYRPELLTAPCVDAP